MNRTLVYLAGATVLAAGCWIACGGSRETLAGVGVSRPSHAAFAMSADSTPELKNVSGEKPRETLSSWAHRDPQKMIQWLGTVPYPSELWVQGYNALVEVFPTHNPGALFVWMEQALPEAARGELYRPFFQIWADREPEAAGARLSLLVEGVDEPSLWNSLIPLVAVEWSKSGRTEALTWLYSLPRGLARDAALNQVMAQWTALNPAQAARFAVENNDLVLVKAVASKWAEQLPSEAALWASSLPLGENREIALIQVSAIWSRSDPMRMAAWAQQFPEAPIREQIWGQLVYTWAGNDAVETEK